MNQVMQSLLRIQLIKAGFGVPVMLLLLLAMMILPLPPLLLDLFFTFSITLSMLVLLAAIYALRPLDFASFPTILLLTTLTRLALNVASTRVVLLHGHNGTAAAGKVIEAFGEVVIGGNYAVGIVVFLILVIINFVVVTKGAGRISEVSARFTLDSLPGKQMAIDADLNAGLINQEQAVKRREELGMEVDFYGSMDGASKFVRGDAIAGILILVINLFGGICIGVLQHDLSFSEAASIYAILTIGDGLVAQIPALILSTAAALLVTRVSKSEDLSKQLSLQLFGQFKPILISGITLVVLGLIPGMPHSAFLSIGLLLICAAVLIFNPSLRTSLIKTLGLNATSLFNNIAAEIEAARHVSVEEVNITEEKDIGWEDLPTIDSIGMDIGFKLIPLVDNDNNKGELMSRIKGVRKKLSQELGFLIPPVHIKDNLDMVANSYRITVNGVIVGENKIQPDQDLAINPGQNLPTIRGLHVKEPSFGLDAYWINKSERQSAQTQGYTVVDASTAVATHLSQVMKNYAAQLLGHQEVEKLLTILRKDSPKLADALVPEIIPMGTLVKVLQNLLLEQVPLTDFRTIAQTLVEKGAETKNAQVLTEHVRHALGPMIIQQINGFTKELAVASISPDLEQLLLKTIKANEGSLSLDPKLAERLQKGLQQLVDKFEVTGLATVLLCVPELRAQLAKLARNWAPDVNVISYNEVPDDKSIKVMYALG